MFLMYFNRCVMINPYYKCCFKASTWEQEDMDFILSLVKTTTAIGDITGVLSDVFVNIINVM